MRFLLRRLGLYLVAAWVGVTLNFLLPRLMPGDAATAAFASQYQRLSSNPAALSQIRAALGVSNDPLPVQYLNYWADLLQGNLGISFSHFPTPVTTVLAQSLPWTLTLVGTAAVVSFLFGTGMGIVAAWRRGGALDTVVPSTALFVGAFPAFFLAMLLQYLVAKTLGLLPPGHGYTPGIPPSWTLRSAVDLTSHALLPIATIVIISMGGWMLGMRNAMINVLSEDYVTMAEARGLSPRRVMLAYAARNALLPQLTGFAMALGFLIGGQILVEYVFTYPGLGSLLANAVGSNDYPLIQGLLLLITLCVLLANLVIDLIYSVLDPRTREP